MDKHFNNKPWVSSVYTLDNLTPLLEITNISHKKRSLFSHKELPSKLKYSVVNLVKYNIIIFLFSFDECTCVYRRG